MTYGRSVGKAMAHFHLDPARWHELAADRAAWRQMLKDGVAPSGFRPAPTPQEHVDLVAAAAARAVAKAAAAMAARSAAASQPPPPAAPPPPCTAEPRRSARLMAILSAAAKRR